VNFENIFKSVVETSKLKKGITKAFVHVRILQIFRLRIFDKVAFLKELFIKNSSNLNKTQKVSANFLCEFHNIFSESIVAENCDVVEHVINMKNSLESLFLSNYAFLRLSRMIEETRCY